MHVVLAEFVQTLRSCNVWGLIFVPLSIINYSPWGLFTIDLTDDVQMLYTVTIKRILVASNQSVHKKV